MSIFYGAFLYFLNEEQLLNWSCYCLKLPALFNISSSGLVHADGDEIEEFSVRNAKSLRIRKKMFSKKVTKKNKSLRLLET